MKRLLIFFGMLVLTAILFQSCFLDGLGTGITGNGNVEEIEYEAAPFEELEITGAFNVYFTQGTSQSVIIETDENIHDYIEANTSGKKLIIQMSEKIKKAKKRDIYITVENLSSVVSSGANNLYFETPFTSDDFSISIKGAGILKKMDLIANQIDMNISGASDVKGNIKCGILQLNVKGASSIILTGEAGTQLVEVSGASSVNLQNIISNQITAKASGASNITVKKIENLDIQKTGSAIIDEVD